MLISKPPIWFLYLFPKQLLTTRSFYHVKGYRRKYQAHFTGTISYDKVSKIYGWLSYDIHCLLPFSIVRQPDVRPYMHYEHSLLNSFMLSIKNMLPEKFALIFNGLPTSDSYVSMFSTFSFDDADGYLCA